MNRRDDEQPEAKVAFWITVMAQLLALFAPGTDGSSLWRHWWAELNLGFSLPKLPALITALFFLGANVLWLVSPFLARVYSQLAVVRTLVLVLSAAAVIWFYMFGPDNFSPYTILLAAGSHLVGMFFIRKQAPGPD